MSRSKKKASPVTEATPEVTITPETITAEAVPAEAEAVPSDAVPVEPPKRRDSVSNEDLYAAYKTAIENGLTVTQLAESVKMNEASMSARISTLRSELKAKGATPEQVSLLLPSLTRKKGSGRPNTKGGFLDSLLASLTPAPPAE